MASISRRELSGLLGIAAANAAEPRVLPPWAPGTLELHHISTGRGNCTLVLAPNGETILIDAGDVHRPAALERYYVTARPDASRRPGQWLTRYLRRHLARSGRKRIDTFLLTHFHGDHMGSLSNVYPRSRFGDYQLTGIMDIAEEIEIGRIVDRAWPNYNEPAPLVEPDALNYVRFAKNISQRGTVCERFLPGSSRQLSLLGLKVQNLGANGVIWTGKQEQTRSIFPPVSQMAKADIPDENKCSLSIRMNFGSFSYYSGGDLTGPTRYGEPSWLDVETPVARACGPVSVAVANHHGFLDACGPEWVKALHPRCFIIHGWTSAHPTMPALHNMLSRDIYPAERSVFSTATRAESRIAVREIDDMASCDGHVVLRVPPSGDSFSVYVTSDRDENDHITATFGPWAAREL